MAAEGTHSSAAPHRTTRKNNPLMLKRKTFAFIPGSISSLPGTARKSPAGSQGGTRFGATELLSTATAGTFALPPQADSHALPENAPQISFLGSEEHRPHETTRAMIALPRYGHLDLRDKSKAGGTGDAGPKSVVSDVPEP